MARLARTIAELSRYRRAFDSALGRAKPQAAAAPTTTKLREVAAFGANPGNLRMLEYVPATLAEKPALLVVLHGCTQTAAGYDHGAGWTELADRHGFALMFPEQKPENNPQRCFSWFEPADVRRDGGEAASIRQMIARMVAAHGVDRRRIFITGLSAGGAMASAMLATYPEVFAGGAIIAGLPYGTASNVKEAFESMFKGRSSPPRRWGDLVRAASPHRGAWPKISIWHGSADATVVPMNRDEIVKQWTDVHGLPATPSERRTGRGVERAVWRDRDGREVIEAVTIPGMAHGTPLATGAAEDACGEAGPFLLEAGISSSYRIAKFFGLTGAARASAPARKVETVERTPLAPDDHVEIIPDERVEILGKDGDRFEDTRGPMNVMAIITKALTSAGLMKPPA